MSPADMVERDTKVKRLSFRNAFKLHSRTSRSGTPSPLLTSHSGTSGTASGTNNQLVIPGRLGSSPSPSNLSIISSDQSSRAPRETDTQIITVPNTDAQCDAGHEPNQVSPETENGISLWDQAYNNLRDENVQLLNKYEGLLKKRLLPANSAPNSQASDSDNQAESVLDPRQRQKQLSLLVEQGLKQQDTKGKICIAGQMIAVRDILLTIGKNIEIVQNWISKAVQASPQASVAWSVICLALPLLTRPASNDKEIDEGFTYVLSRMQYYIAMERLVLPVECTAESKRPQDHLQSQLVMLYQYILEFQIKSILRFDQSIFKSVAGDIWGGTDWKAMHEDILKLEKTIHQDLLNVSASDSRNLLNHMLQTVVENGQQIQLLLEKNYQNGTDMLANLRQINQQELSRDERECLQVLCLDPPYSDFKDVVHERVEGTCMWFLSQQAYKDWVTEPEGCLLVSADPGCGKSVLAKFLIEQELIRSCPGSIICYFFFKDQIQNRLCMALCGLLHQLFDAEPRLIKHAQAKFHRHGTKLQGNAQALFEILADALADPIGVPVIFVLDAMNECDEGDCAKLFRTLKTLQLRTKTGTGRLKMLLTSRPYHNIIFDFEPENPSFDLLQVSSESESLNQLGSDIGSLPKGWEMGKTKEGRIYYIDHITGTTTSNHPQACDLPPGWDICFSDEGELYFVDYNTESSTWDDPRLPLSGPPAETLHSAAHTMQITAQNGITQPLSSDTNIPQYHRGSKRIHIPGELESEAISQEVNIVIRHRLEELCQKGKLKEDIRTNLEKQLLSQSNRTYLWVYFLFDELQHMIKPTWKETERKLTTLPTSVNEAYEGILSRCAVNDEIKQNAIRTLCVMLAAKRSLSLREIQIAVRIEFDPPSSQHDDLDLQDDREFANKLRNWCGLFIQVYKGRVTFIHQTGKEFLLAKKIYSTKMQPLETWRWQGFTNLEYAHTIIAQCCMIYLGLRDEPITSLHKLRQAEKNWPTRAHRIKLVSELNFLEYAAENWDWHFVEGHCETNDDLLELALGVCDPNSVACTAWNIVKFHSRPLHSFSHRLVIAASLDPRLLPVLLAKGETADQLDDDIYERIFLEAARSGHESIMELIWSRGIDVNMCANAEGRTALHVTFSLSCIEFLLKSGAQIDVQDEYGKTPLHLAIVTGNIKKAELLLQCGASTTIRCNNDDNALLYASAVNKLDFVQLVLLHSPDLNVYNADGEDPLIIATRNSNEQVMKLLLEHGAKANSQDSLGFTPLHYTARVGHLYGMELLLGHGAKVNSQDIHGSTPLHYAAWIGHVYGTAMLLKNGADLNVQDTDCSTAQDMAASRGHSDIVKILHETKKLITRRSSMSDLWPLKPYWDQEQNHRYKSVYNKTGRR